MIKLTHLLSFLVLFLLGMTADAQQKKNIYGYVEDAITQERLSGVVVVSKATNATTTTNAYGFFSLSLLSPANYILEIRSLGFKTQTLSLLLQKDTLLIIKLAPNVQQLDEVKIMEQTPPHQQTLGGYHRLSAQTIAKIPALAGEVDVLKSLLLLPGVQMGKEGTVGINVRGGTPDQNLVLLDGAPVYNINHLFGFLSVFK